jgi:hypothetical protein
MYPDGPGQLVDGWTKNFATGAGATPLLRLVATVFWIGALGSGVVALVDAARGTLSPWLAVLAYLGTVVSLRRLATRVGSFGWLTVLCYPVALVAFVAVFLRSLWLTRVRRQVRWRGRRIATGPDRG